MAVHGSPAEGTDQMGEEDRETKRHRERQGEAGRGELPGVSEGDKQRLTKGREEIECTVIVRREKESAPR